jgi:hypothetical protein
MDISMLKPACDRLGQSAYSVVRSLCYGSEQFTLGVMLSENGYKPHGEMPMVHTSTNRK